jgi:hypothetical protein
MITDRQDNALSGASGAAAELFDKAVEAFNIYRGDPVGLLDMAIETAPEFAMAYIMKAHLFGLATEPEATKEAKSLVARAKTLRLSDREASHVAALDRLLDGNWTAAGEALDRHSMDYPHDMVALQSGQLMDFYRANARDLRPGTRSCLACTRSASRRPATTCGPRKRGVGRSICSHSTAGPTTPSPM